MRSLPLVLLLLIGVQAVLKMGGGGAMSPGAANHSTEQQTAAYHRAGQQQTAAGDHEHQTVQDQRTSQQLDKAASLAQERSPILGYSEPDDSSIPEVDPKLFTKRRHRSSPRVVFSEVPPSHDALGVEAGEAGEAGGVRGPRVRRRAEAKSEHRGIYSVCDSTNVWVTNMTQAVDMGGKEVTVLTNVKINNRVMMQLFYETVCRSETPVESRTSARGVSGGGRGAKPAERPGCRGIDKRHWNSYCTNSHTYVRALTVYQGLTAWRLIRINAACECVISRKSWRH